MNKKYWFISILILINIFPNNALAATKTNDYTIENYDIDIVVNKNNTFNITEKITVDF